MNQKAAFAIRIVLGGYLAYLGVRIIIEMTNEKPSNMIFMTVAGVFFLVVGAGYAGYCIKKVWEIRQSERNPQTHGQEGERSVSEIKPEDVKTGTMKVKPEEVENGTGKVKPEEVKIETEKDKTVGTEEKEEEIETDYEEK